MCCTNGSSCVPAIALALQGSQQQAVLAAKICGLIDLIALIRDQIGLDQGANLTLPSATTQSLAVELMKQIDALGEIYNADRSNVSSTSKNAQYFGITMEINCRLLNVLIKQCYSTNGVANFTLGNFVNSSVSATYAITPQVNYAFNYQITPTEFLCCIAEQFARLQSFLERFVNAKKCESIC